MRSIVTLAGVVLWLISHASEVASASEPSPQKTAPMNPATRLVTEVFQAFNRHDLPALVSHYSADARLTSSDWCHALHGRDELARKHGELFAASPDVHDELIDVVAAADIVAVRFVSRGHIAGHPFELEIADFFRLRGGLIVEDDTIFDNGGRACES